MYHHSLLFVIISKNDNIEGILREIEPLEDCTYTFRTVLSGQDEAVNSQNPDMALLYDSVGGAGFLLEKQNHGECVLVAEEGNALLTDRKTVSAVSEFWVLPGQGTYDKELLTAYFERLARRMKERADARKQGICFETLINSVPDISWFKDISGAHLIVNDSFCGMVGKTKEQIYKKGHCYIWDASKEDEEVCLNSDRIIMDSRKTNIFEESIKTKSDMRLLKSYKSALIDTDGTIFGTCGIAHDETELQNMSTELEIVFDRVPFAVLVEDAQGIVINKNAQFDSYFPQFADIQGQPSEVWRQSLSKKLLVEERIMEVVIQSETESRVLMYEEEPIKDIFGRNMGKIVTLMDITLQWNASQQNVLIANTDYLTGLNNRRNLMSYLAGVYSQKDVSLLMLDLDNFKQVNDHFGHEAGDRALIKTSELLKECFPEDYIARMGGDEFMLVVKGRTLSDVKHNAERLSDRLRTEFQGKVEFQGITLSIGIVSIGIVPKKRRSVSELLQIVDDMLYEAKNSGKNCYRVYGEKM